MERERSRSETSSSKKSLSQRQLILDLVYRKIKAALRTSLLDDESAKTATEAVRACLQELALSNEFCNDLIPFPATIIPLPEKSFWNCGSVTPFICTFQHGDDCDYKAFKLDTIESGHGLYVAYEIPTFPRVFGLATKRYTVKRRYSEFDELRRLLTKEFKYRLLDEKRVETHRVGLLLVPNLPPKSSFSLSSKFDPSFVYERSRALQFWIEYVSLHSLMQVCFPVNQFLSKNSVIKQVHTRNVLEKRAQKRLRDMRKKYASGGVAIVAMRAAFMELQTHLNTSWQALRLCAKTQRKLDNARDQVGHSIIEFTRMEENIESCEIISMFGVTLRNTFTPLDAQAFDPFKQCCRLFSKEIIPKMQKLVGDIASLSDTTFEHNIENERVAVEWIEARDIRQTMLARRAEKLVHEQISNAQNTIRVFKQLKIDIENWSNCETRATVRQRYENMDADTQERVKIARIQEALDAIHADLTDEEVDDDDFERQPFSSPFKRNVYNMQSIDTVNIHSRSNLNKDPESTPYVDTEPKREANIPPAGEPTSSTHYDNIGSSKKSKFHSETESKMSKDIKNALMKIHARSELKKQHIEKKTKSVASQPKSPFETDDNDEVQQWVQARTEEGLIYYYHPVTRATKWDKPDKVTKLNTEKKEYTGNEEESNLTSAKIEREGYVSQLHDKRQENRDVEDIDDFSEHWIQAESEDGLIYYYHPVTRATRWDKPDKEMQMKIEKRIRASKHEERKRREERIKELEHYRKEEIAMELKRMEIDREVQRSITLWKESLRQDDLAEMLSRLSGIIKLDMEEYAGGSMPDASILRNDSKKLKKLYRRVLMRVHPDKIRPNTTLQQSRLQTFVFTTISAAAEGLF